MLYDQLISLVKNYLEEGDIFIYATSWKLSKGTATAPVVISNEENVFTLLIYIVGIIKNSSMEKGN